MARRSKSTRQRDTSSIANDLSALLPRPFPFRDPVAVLSDIEDRRTFSPGSSSYRSVRGNRHRLVVAPKARVRPAGPPRTAGLSLSPTVSFHAPAHVLVCVRRQRRREVMFALGRSGKGSKGPRRRNAASNISCRRS